ncbi:SEC12-like protein 2 [Ananas comosus]|uniref:SEC12-like protein 2 n=1 Tax=Ananas comosus TaxID=4615 RepID=A0A199VVR5_ANACO|nr:SEC12-like protein 2 [Ananas comosus]
MARGRREIPPCSKTYGFPIYCAAWVPLSQISAAAAAADDDDDDHDNDKRGEGGGGGDPSLPRHKGDRLLVTLGGGGGEGRSGVPNALVVSHFDLPSRSLSDQPVFRMGTDADVPYRMAVHPGGDGIICSFPKNCRWLSQDCFSFSPNDREYTLQLFKWDFSESEETLSLRSPGETLENLEDGGLQLALSFNEEGSILATGSEDGGLMVFKWPSMESVLEETVANTTVKDLDFSSDGKFLASLRNSGPCKVWDLASSKVVANLSREDGEIFSFCRFSRSSADSQVLFVTAMHGDQGKIISWNTTSWKRIGTKRIVRDPISAFNISSDGKLMAIGTTEGSIEVLSSANMQVQTRVKKAHLGIVTALVFSHDSRALLSSSFDSTARVTTIETRKSNGFSAWIIILVIILAILVYFMKSKQTL